MPLVEFIEHHRSHTAQLRVVDQPAREDALGDVPEARAGRAGFLEADLIARRDAFRRHAFRRRACRDPAGLQHDHVALHEVEQRRRNARRLAGSRRRFENDRRPGAQSGEELRQQRIDGERFFHAGKFSVGGVDCERDLDPDHDHDHEHDHELEHDCRGRGR